MSVDWERWAYVVALLCYTLLMFCEAVPRAANGCRRLLAAVAPTRAAPAPEMGATARSRRKSRRSETPGQLRLPLDKRRPRGYIDQ